jgi:hypothetical protein
MELQKNFEKPQCAYTPYYPTLDMGSSVSTPQPFRFLDLPPELRCRVYELIDIPSTRHILDKNQFRLYRKVRPRLTLIKSRGPLEILLVCRLIIREASPILKRKTEDCYRQPSRYLMNYGNALVKDLTLLCANVLSQRRQGESGVRIVEITVDDKFEFMNGLETRHAMWLLRSFVNHHGPI